MKRIIYTAVALIICASVFGIADYLNAREQGALVNYSDDVQTTEAVTPEKKKDITPASTEKIISSPMTEVKKEKPQMKIFKSKMKRDKVISTPVIIEEKTEPIIEKDIVDLVLQSKVTDSIMQPEQKRKINMEMFSRAPIREMKIKKK